ncbi:putative N6-adenine methyltransferase-domain-containing protein [Lipomyces tetrasporus]|uniref:Protein-lysine N-methyltransferase EFM5 n=1 Tax=Lipomyces tetrasporus TaxID=54092 RepID=A0AAD7QSN7_9ASCO|nr:putative N6-adenine methyltransferase-domain-containing protein [Lipomyces tetrasporus]KAJ8100738.1 putative N6-adenine methyltransferase-domain-containing protein [Lipomyces tetrasporus]
MTETDEFDDIPTLPADTLALLQDFQQSQSARLAAFEKLKARAGARFDSLDDAESHPSAEADVDGEEERDGDDPLANMEIFTEDWNLSQFWYTDVTARTLCAFVIHPLVNVPLDLEGRPTPHPNYEELPDISIAILSAPTVHQYLTRCILPLLPKPVQQKIHPVLFEHDVRFTVFGPNQFVHYDFNAPARIPEKMKSQFDAVIVDPPFLSAECQVKTAITARLLLSSEQGRRKIVVCTGQKVADVILRTYRPYGVRCTKFRPEHRNGLQNEFRCFASGELDGVWTFEQEE